MTKGLKTEIEKCVGCNMCALVCSGSHVGKFNPSESRMNVEDIFPEPGEFKLNYCIQCEEHPCVEACPAEAIKLDDSLGIYVVDKDECTACGLCVDACPHNGCWLDPSESYSIKCDLCGGAPRCIDICPRKVISRGD
ncbi:TPA: 4Fe-4S dicluster domain-containing protein [Thermoplasmata archaeon]|nr:4Fe-4S dicluster domain-containing protein [Thermoplasmata archaeon]